MKVYAPDGVILAADLPPLLEKIARHQQQVSPGAPMQKEVDIPSHNHTCVIDEYMYAQPEWQANVKIFRAVEHEGTVYFLARKLDSYYSLRAIEQPPQVAD